MADIRLISIIPLQPTAGIPQTPGTSGISTPGPTIQINLPAGSILSGFIVNRDPQGNPVLRTDKGDVVFSTNFFLKIGSEVVIRLENRAQQLQAHILSVNGESPEVAEQQSAYAQQPEVIVGRETKPTAQPTTTAAPTADTIVRPPANTTITGTLLPPIPSAGNAPTPTLPPGTQLTFKLVTITAPTPQEPAAPTTPAPSYTAYTRSVLLAPAPTTSAAPIAAQPAAPTASIPAVATETALPPAISAPTPLPIKEGQTLQALVIGNEPSGEILVQSPVGLIRLQPGTSLPPHSQITFEIVKIVTSTGTLETAQLRPTPLPELARSWPALQEIFSLLAASAPQIGAAAPAINFPGLLQSPPENAASLQHMPMGLMIFIAALRGGDFRNWLGADNVDSLQARGHEALIKKAEGDFTAIARQFVQAQPGQWQPVFFPLVVAGQLEQLRLFVKRDRKKDANQSGKKDEDTRFVLEMTLSQLGEMQMDGFVRQQNQAMEFDLFIRSLNPLTPEIQRDILEIYTKTGELTGYKGQLLFQSVKSFPIHPMEELIAEHMNSVIA